MKIAIIGAGPIGNYTGHLLAKRGYQVDIYEEHAQIGNPIQCTGLLSADFDKFQLPMDDFLVNVFSEIRVESPNHKIKIPQKEYLVCRTKFDQFFGDLAINSGANIHLSHSFLRKENKNLIIKDIQNKKEIRISPDIVIAADGPLSKTAKAYGLYEKSRENYFGVQAVIKGDFSEKYFTAYFSQSLCPDLFAWVVPESKTLARVGLGSKKNSRKLYDAFMGKYNLKENEVKEMQGGTIPLYSTKQRMQKDNCYLLGDAAGQVKATTLGGLIPGLDAAQILVDSIINKKNYHKALDPVRRKLWLHLQIRRIMDKFSDDDWDYLLKLVNQEKVKSVFTKYARDNPIPLVTNVLIKEPHLLYFLKYVF